MSDFILGCGSGGTRLLSLSNNQDYNTLQRIDLSYDLYFLSTSGFIAASLDTHYNCYYWCEEKRFLLKTEILKIACGWTHVLMMSSVEVYTYGNGAQGQLGLGDIKSINEPIGLRISSPLFVGCGFRTSFVIATSGTFVFGENQKYQLWLGHKQLIKTPIINHNIPEISEITGGNKHTVGYKGKKLYVWGNNTFGQLGIDMTEANIPEMIKFSEKIVKISCGWNHTAVLLKDKNLLITGKGDLGQQGCGEFSNNKKFSCVMQNVSNFECGSEHVVAISNKNVYAWGWNEHGNIGTGDNINRCTPVFIYENASNVYAGGAVTYIL